MNKKLKIVLLVMSGLVLIVLAYIFASVVLPDNNISFYGNRKENVVEIKNESINETIKLIKEHEFINTANAYVGGVLIVNIIIDIKKDTKLLLVESMLDKVLNLYTDAEKEAYDFQVFVTCKEDTSEDSAYPIIGYKHKTSLSFKWTNNS